MPRVNTEIKTCVLCGKDRPFCANGDALGHAGPMCHPCYQKEWRRRRRPGPFQADAQEVARLHAEIEAMRADADLGRMLRAMPVGTEIARTPLLGWHGSAWNEADKWWYSSGNDVDDGSPEGAILAATASARRFAAGPATEQGGAER